MKQLIILLTIFIVMSCDKETNEPDSFVLSANVDIIYLNKTGDDLLNHTTDEYFQIDSMKLFYIIEGEVIEVYDPNMASPRNIMLMTETTPNRLRIFTPDNINEFTSEKDGIKYGTAITLLKLTDIDTDTIKTGWSYKEGKYFVIDKVWYNDVLQESVDSVITVVK